MDEPRVLVWFSTGAASAVAAKMALAKYDRDRVHIVRCETSNEDPDNYRFEADVVRWLNHPITVLKSDKYASVWDVFQRRRNMAGKDGAPCTMYMKVMPRLDFQRPNDIHIFGYTSDAHDIRRYQALRDTYFELTVDAPLIEASIRKDASLQMVLNAGIDLPRSYAMGFPNANCLQTGCVKATSPDYWSLYRHHFPDNFKRMAEYSREIGKRLVRIKDERRFLDELPVDWPMLQPIAPACDFLCVIAEKQLEDAL